MTEDGYEKDDDVERRSVTIKGIRNDLYKRMKELAYETGKTLGDVTNDAYLAMEATADGLLDVSRNFQMGLSSGGSKVLGHMNELELTGKEIADANKKILIRNVKKLTLKDIDDKTATRYIFSIRDVDELVIPQGLSKVELLSRCTSIGKVVQE